MSSAKAREFPVQHFPHLRMTFQEEVALVDEKTEVARLEEAELPNNLNQGWPMIVFEKMF